MGRKKIFKGSILTVTILTLISFSNVVAYQSFKSYTIVNSPLLSIRNNEGVVSSDYLGKGDDVSIYFGNNLDNPFQNLPILIKWTTAMCTYYYPIGWYCYITYGPFCKATTGPICDYITSGPFCSWITFQPGCDYEGI